MAELIATRAAYGETLVRRGAENPRLVVLDADLAHATMTKHFAKAFPERFFNVGVAEANMTDVAAGLSTMGYVPVVSTFAVFGTGRNFEQIRNAVCYPKANVKLAMTHAGISVGPDGGSHQSVEDLALMRSLPNITVLCPADARETEKALRAVLQMDGPAYLRLSRMPSRVLPDQPFTIGKINCLRQGQDSAIFTCGIMVERALDAAEILLTQGIDIAVYNVHTIKPIDVAVVRACTARYERILTLEEHSVIGGLGDAVAAVLCEHGGCRLKKLGLQDTFGQSGPPEELLHHYRLDAESIAADAAAFLK